MPNWKEIVQEAQFAEGQAHLASRNMPDTVRRKYLSGLHKLTKRNVITYYSAWLQKPELTSDIPYALTISDNDKNGFMATVHGLDRDKGLDLLIHTPGGDIATTESIVDYLRAMFSDFRVIVPQLAMSAGTMIALASKKILMGKHSSLGPIDPQIGGMAAHGIIEEFEKAREEIKRDGQSAVELWRPIIAKYNPTLIGICKKAIDFSEEIVKKWLEDGMFKGDEKPKAKAEGVVKQFGDHALNKSHSRHIPMNKAVEWGVKVKALEGDQELQDAVLAVHHSYTYTMSVTSAVKIIENHNGIAFVQHHGTNQ